MSFRHGVLILWLAAGSGCAASPPKPAAQPATIAAAPHRPHAPGPLLAPGAEPRSWACAAPAIDGAPNDPSAPSATVSSICQAKCDKLLDKCAKTAVETCRLNCSKYEPPPAGCMEQVRSALECARDARDLTCANVAPESCAAPFKALAACSAGEAPLAKSPPPLPGLPSGWETITDRANGFSVAMPLGSAQRPGPEGPIRSVQAPDGTTYTVSVRPLLNERPSEKSLLHFLMQVQGRCSDKVKLDGFVEKEAGSSIHYTAHCPDKTDWNGMIYVGRKNLFFLSAQAVTGKVGVTEPFFYQFELAER